MIPSTNKHNPSTYYYISYRSDTNNISDIIQRMLPTHITIDHLIPYIKIADNPTYLCQLSEPCSIPNNRQLIIGRIDSKEEWTRYLRCACTLVEARGYATYLLLLMITDNSQWQLALFNTVRQSCKCVWIVRDSNDCHEEVDKLVDMLSDSPLGWFITHYKNDEHHRISKTIFNMCDAKITSLTNNAPVEYIETVKTSHWNNAYSYQWVIAPSTIPPPESNDIWTVIIV